jgi:hypothetical protein
MQKREFAAFLRKKKDWTNAPINAQFQSTMHAKREKDAIRKKNCAANQTPSSWQMPWGHIQVIKANRTFR